jgi:uncharacterized protein (DUF1778 family)
MTKEKNINVRVTPELKLLIRELAAADGRSLTSYIESLVKRDARRRERSRRRQPE